MKANWNGWLFMYERLDQAKMAAFEYVNGEPLPLGSLTLNQKFASTDSNTGKHDLQPERHRLTGSQISTCLILLPTSLLCVCTWIVEPLNTLAVRHTRALTSATPSLM
jgi:hypothetical protein